MTPLPHDPRSSSDGAAARQRTPPERTLPSQGQPRAEPTLRAARPAAEPDAPTESRLGSSTRAADARRPRPSRSGPSARRLEPGEQIGHYRIVSKLGEGGMGVVYKATDIDRNELVALKTLHRVDPDSVSRLKNEFRSSVDIAHRNLVVTHELVATDDMVFFTMELLDGVSFLEHVRDDAAIRVARTVSMSSIQATEAAQITTSVTSEPPPRPGASLAPPALSPNPAVPLVQTERLRLALRQLAAGVNALHAAGKIHRDLKPGNVIVTHTGRVVILDFSLAASLSMAGMAANDVTAGTPAFMAPEQVLGLPATAATDWYAVGVMLYQALTGRLPYEGSVDQIIKAKRKDNPPRHPSSHAPGVPADLGALCLELLSFNPEARPTGPDIEARLLAQDRDLAVSSSRSPVSSRRFGPPSSAPIPSLRTTSSNPSISANPIPSATPSSPTSARSSVGPRSFSPPFIGRETHLAALEAAYQALRDGSAATVYLHGRSGMGKSALVRSFLADVRQRGGALVLEGRCYERENVPYKAFDSLADAIARHLQKLQPEQVAQLLPEGALDLARLFPVLQSVESIGATQPEPEADIDLLERRRHAFRALKALLRRMGRARPLILWIDDLQWGDRDSAHLLTELFAPPDAPLLLFLGTYRTEEEETSPLLRELFQAEVPSLEALILDVGPLEHRDASRLARAMLGEEGAEPSQRAARIADESEGCPLFVEELVRYLHTGGDGRSADLDASSPDDPAEPPDLIVSLEALLATRITELPDDARALLEVIALAGRPIRQGIAAEAMGGGPSSRAALALLRGRHLVRTRGSRDRDAVEVYHDRIRDAVSSRLEPAARARLHLRLARALEAGGAAEPEQLALHFRGGGDLARAAEYAEHAAERAAAALAFDRAADFYQIAVACHAELDALPTHIAPLQGRLADALANAGRGAEAAPIYLAAAESLPKLQALRLRGRAAEQLLGSGRIGEGVTVLAPALRAVGLSYPASPGRALLLVIGRMLRISLRGRRYRERDESALSPEDLLRLDVCWWAAKGLLSFDSIRAAAFLLKYVLLALQAGEPRHIARALVFFGMLTVYEGTRRGIRKGNLLMAEAERIAERFASPYLDGVILGCKGIAAVSAGNFHEGISHLAAGSEILKSRCSAVRWEVSTCASGSCSALIWLGEFRELGRIANASLRDAEQIGDIFSIVEFQLFCATVDLASGDIPAARARAAEAMSRWYAQAFTYQHWFALKVEVWCDLHDGDVDAASRRLDAAWSTLEASKLLRVRLFALDAHFLRGTVALAGAAADIAAGRPARRNLRAVQRDARFLIDLDFGECSGLGDLLLAGALALSGDTSAAISHLDVAIRRLDAAGMYLHVACARLRKGHLLGGKEGRALVVKAEGAMRDEGIANPPAWRRLYAPG
ncbi:serine/threonine-protein kinase [Chondromyces apiculatus]|uniref:serine/threonine-protein kinase n=1 Tax=Chondromyces apiculatus TaxID=51 RepID=UPI0012DBFCF6|nr:serine/threonine-protein kinase [Chondromyces apiculatus]